MRFADLGSEGFAQSDVVRATTKTVVRPSHKVKRPVVGRRTDQAYRETQAYRESQCSHLTNKVVNIVKMWRRVI